MMTLTRRAIGDIVCVDAQCWVLRHKVPVLVCYGVVRE